MQSRNCEGYDPSIIKEKMDLIVDHKKLSKLLPQLCSDAMFRGVRHGKSSESIGMSDIGGCNLKRYYDIKISENKIEMPVFAQPNYTMSLWLGTAVHELLENYFVELGFKKEYNVQITIDGLLITSEIDAVYITDKMAHVIDYKTTMKRDFELPPNGICTLANTPSPYVQLNFYMGVLKECYGFTDVKGSIVCIRINQPFMDYVKDKDKCFEIIDFEFSKELYNETKAHNQELIDVLHNKKDKKMLTLNTKWCNYCARKYLCNDYINLLYAYIGDNDERNKESWKYSPFSTMMDRYAIGTRGQFIIDIDGLKNDIETVKQIMEGAIT